jgi:hypothetical protein
VAVTAKTKEGVLFVLTGLALAYVRHGIESGWAWWESVEQFFGDWFIHTMALSLFIAIAGVTIEKFHEFFLGHKREAEYTDLIYVILMTVLVGAVCVFLLAHWSPSGDD